MPVIKDSRQTYYEVLQKEGKTWEVYVLGIRGLWLHETLDGAMEVAKELERHGNMVMVRPVYVNQWGSITLRGRAVYTTGKERKKHNGKIQKARHQPGMGKSDEKGDKEDR